MFADLDESLRQLLIREVPLAPSDVDIAFERPDRERTSRFSRPTVDLFLFSVEENLDLIESGWEVTRNDDRSTTQHWPALRVDVRYLVTVWTQEIDDEHQLLYLLYRAFRRVPELPPELLQGAMANQPRPVPLFLDPTELRALMDVWTAMDNTVRASLVLRATIAIDLNDVRQVPAVSTSGLRISAGGQPPETRFSVSGRVRSANGEAVAGASVQASGRRLGVFSDEAGIYHITSLRGPEVELTARAPGYGESVRTISLPGDYDFTLSPQASGSGREGGRSRGQRGGGGGA
jgi:Pvc16 N-terminal domain/Carboxypeptidase regulatory-like domain